MLFHEWLLKQERLLRVTEKCGAHGVTQSVVHDSRGSISITGPIAAANAQLTPQTEGNDDGPAN